jgi:zinc transport system substrate-binding protein
MLRSALVMKLRRFLPIVAALWLWPGDPSTAGTATPLTVYVSVLPQQQFAEAIGGQHIRAHVMVGPGRSPASYEPSPRQMIELADARLYWRIGVPFEDVWMARIADANPSMRILDARDGITLRDMESAAAVFSAEPGHGGHDDHVHSLKDPHIWLSPPLVRHMCERFRDALVTLDPAHAADYRANFERYAQQLDQLDADIRRTLTSVPSRRFMVFHPAWGYFAHTYGLTQIPIEIEGKSPGPRTLAAIIDLARHEHIHVIFVQQQFSRTDAEAVARAIDARVVAVDPLAADYMTNLRQVAQRFAAAMQ